MAKKPSSRNNRGKENSYIAMRKYVEKTEEKIRKRYSVSAKLTQEEVEEIKRFFTDPESEQRIDQLMKQAGLRPRRGSKTLKAEQHSRMERANLRLELMWECWRTAKTVKGYLSNDANLKAFIRNRVRDHFRYGPFGLNRTQNSDDRHERYINEKRKQAEREGKEFDPEQIRRYKQKPSVFDLAARQRVSQDREPVTEEELAQFFQPLFESIKNQQHREIFKLHVLNRWEYKQIAQQLGKPEKSVKTTLSRIRRGLAQTFCEGYFQAEYGDRQKVYNKFIRLIEGNRPISNP
jgi:RNA polymerase sigma factor (sigma-70 family)